MKAEMLLSKAIENLPYGLSAEYESEELTGDSDGLLTIVTPQGEKLTFATEIKQIFRISTLGAIRRMSDEAAKYPLLLICNQLSEGMSEYCSQNGINYIDIAGNMQISVPGLYMHVAGKQAEKAIASAGSLPEGVMKLLFVLLSEPDLLNKPYRKLAELSGISLGMVSKGFELLEQRRHYRKAQSGRRLIEPEALCTLWIKEYARALKPRLDQLVVAAPESWAHLTLAEGEYKGGELAAAALTDNYLIPGSGIIYTPHSLLQRRKELNLKPVPEAGLQLIRCFWGSFILNEKAKAMLCLADMLDVHDDRTLEVARIINDNYLELSEAALFSY
ncbi:hypothetical protein F3J37_21100 [Pantoea sp. Al-1710]|uniref:Uncharacterized protein n=1 Tax=Candidatus Pantoea communis TaxID=2608354 RepID=A0ABX0RVQ6_9GAMM|nr:type IV toxin-antitoxin system AbiEi family antitoxin [Pantoea communis]NIG21178.1 hypothetical protein [Pantoea communis]